MRVLAISGNSKRNVEMKKDRPVYKNVRFRDLIPGETYRVDYKAFSSEGDSLRSRDLRYSSVVGRIYYFIDVGTGQLISMYRKLTGSLLDLVNSAQQVILILRSTSRLQYTYKLGHLGRDL